MAQIRVAQIKDLSLSTDGIITIGALTDGTANTIKPIVTNFATATANEAATTVLSGLTVEGNQLKPQTTTIAKIREGLVTTENLTQTLASYVTNDSLTTTLAGYVTTGDFTTYQGTVTQALGTKLDTATFNSTIANYYTKTEADTTFVKVADIATSISESPVDNKVASEKAVKTYVDSKIQAADAMRYKGTVANESSLPTDAVNGDTYKASTAFTLANGTKVEAGDMLIYNGTSWDVVQGNIDLASLTGATSAGRDFAVKQNAAGNLVVTVDPLNITEAEHYTPTASENTTSTGSIDALTGGSLAIVTEKVDAKGHVTGIDTKTVTFDVTALTERLEAIDEAIEDASNAAALVMKREVLTINGQTQQADLSEMPVGDVAITQNGLDLGTDEYSVEGVNIRFDLKVAAVIDDVFVAYYMYNTEAQLPS